MTSVRPSLDQLNLLELPTEKPKLLMCFILSTDHFLQENKYMKKEERKCFGTSMLILAPESESCFMSNTMKPMQLMIWFLVLLITYFLEISRVVRKRNVHFLNLRGYRKSQRRLIA